jgi:hypothetical protein
MRSLNARPDVAVRDELGNPIVIVEVKNPETLSLDVATQLRRNMSAHGVLGRIPYFLLVSQETGYLWREQPEPLFDAPPLVQFPMKGVVNRYAPWLEDGVRLRGTELEPVVVQWLTDLSRGSSEPSVGEPERSLAKSGFLDALRGGTVEPLSLV